MLGTKPTHVKGASNFQCKWVEYILPQGRTLDIRYKHDNPIDLTWENINDEDSLINSS